MTRNAVRLAVVFGLAAPSAAAQGHQMVSVTASCQDELIAATVGSSTTTTFSWVPVEKTSNLFHLGTPELTVTIRGVQTKLLPSITLLDVKVNSPWNGVIYEPRTRVVTTPWATYTDRAMAVRGVCVSYAPAARKFMEERAETFSR